ncbi:cyclase family protein [Streptosporangium sp. KLBMP 9127]|nr:cyclase family protein [Streptosporangium sp. KLBMP 9127]
MLVDLSVPIVSGMPVYPGDPEVSIRPALTVAAEGVNVLGLHLGSQSGTHVDAPFHIDDSLPTLDELPLDRFLGPAVVADARGLPAGSPIDASLVAPLLRPGVILLIATGWSAHWGQDEYLAHPWLTPEAATLIVDAGVRTVAVDALSVDPTSPASASPTDPLAAHRILCGAHAVIAENLTGLAPLIDAQSAGRPLEVSLLPIRLASADGAPIRAVARISV